MQLLGAVSYGRFSIGDFAQNTAHPQQVHLTGLGQGQLARGALHQARAQVVFQVTKKARDGGW